MVVRIKGTEGCESALTNRKHQIYGSSISPFMIKEMRQCLMSLITVSDRARLRGGSTLSSRPSTLHAQPTQGWAEGLGSWGLNTCKQGPVKFQLLFFKKKMREEDRRTQPCNSANPWLTLPGQIGLLSKVPRISTTVHTHSVTSVVSDSATPGTVAPRLLCPWDSPGQNTGVGGHVLLQGTFPTQGSNSRLSCISKWVLYC